MAWSDLVLTCVLGYLTISGQLWDSFRGQSLKTHLKVMVATCDHVLLAVWTQMCPGLHWRCYLLKCHLLSTSFFFHFIVLGLSYLQWKFVNTLVTPDSIEKLCYFESCRVRRNFRNFAKQCFRQIPDYLDLLVNSANVLHEFFIPLWKKHVTLSQHTILGFY